MRTYALGKEKWTSLLTHPLSTTRNRRKGHLEAAEKLRAENSGNTTTGPRRFADALARCRRELAVSPVRPATKAFRETGFKTLLGTWARAQIPIEAIPRRQWHDWRHKRIAILTRMRLA